MKYLFQIWISNFIKKMANKQDDSLLKLNLNVATVSPEVRASIDTFLDQRATRKRKNWIDFSSLDDEKTTATWTKTQMSEKLSGITSSRNI